MNLAISTDFCRDCGDPAPWLKYISESGFTHLHWCHHWCDDFFYGPEETAEIARLLRETGLKLLDVHGSTGAEKLWFAAEEYRRKSGVRLVVNRLEFMDRLEATGALMMHIPYARHNATPAEAAEAHRAADQLRRSLDELMPRLEKFHRVLAVENMWADSWEILNAVLDEYPAEYLGICYDSGHANSAEFNQMDMLGRRRDRLQALHLHDNSSVGDDHQPPFYGNVDWAKLADIIRSSSYRRELSFEIAIRCTPWCDPAFGSADQPPENVANFLRDARERGERLAEMVYR